MRRLLPLLSIGLASVAMFAAPAVWACTTFLASHAGQPVFGKDYDWIQSAGLVVTNPRGLQKTALVLKPTDTPAVWTSQYGSITFNQYGVEMPNGGLNEKGLVVEIMWLDSTQYPAPDSRPALNELQWIQHALDLYATVAELAQAAPSVRVSQAYAQVHYLACDASTDCAAFEYIGGQLVITRASAMAAKTLTNDTYAASAAYLAGFTGFGGTAATPTSSSSLDRFVRASTLAQVTAGTTIPDSAFAILDSVAQLSTVWSIVYLPTNGTIYFRTAAMAKVKTVSLGSFSFACGGRKILDIDTDATGDVGSMFGDYTAAANLQLLNRSLANMASAFPPMLISLVAAYPDSCRCVTGDAGAQGGDASDGAIGGAPAGGSGGAGAPGTGGLSGGAGGSATGGTSGRSSGSGTGGMSGGSGGGSGGRIAGDTGGASIGDTVAGGRTAGTNMGGTGAIAGDSTGSAGSGGTGGVAGGSASSAGAPGTGGTLGDSGGSGTGGVLAGAGGYGMGNTSGGSGGAGNAAGGSGDAVAAGGGGSPLAGRDVSHSSGSGGATGGPGGSSSISNNKGGCSCRVGGGRADSHLAIALATIGLLIAAARRRRSTRSQLQDARRDL
jgi:MYXO-CTERM domain-containing protein